MNNTGPNHHEGVKLGLIRFLSNFIEQVLNCGLYMDSHIATYFKCLLQNIEVTSMHIMEMSLPVIRINSIATTRLGSLKTDSSLALRGLASLRVVIGLLLPPPPPFFFFY